MTKWKVSGFRPSPMQGEGFWLYSSYPGVIAPKVLTYPKSLGSHKETDGLCHPGCVIIPTASNLPTVKITSCVIIHRLLTLSFHSRIRSRLYLYINKIPSEAFFFPVLILKISILLSGIQIFPFSKYKFCNCSFLPTSTSTASQCFKHQAGFKFKVLDFSALRSLCKWQHFLNKLTIWGRGWGVYLTSFGIASPFLRSERSAWLCSLCLECPHLSLARVAGQGFWSSLHIFPPWRQN